MVVKAVRGVRRRELVVEPGISAAARHIEERAPARRVAGTQASVRLIIGFAAHRVARGGGRKAADAVARDAVAALDHRAEHEIAHALVIAEAPEIFGSVLVVTAAGVGRSRGTAVTEAGTESIGIAHGRYLVAISATLTRKSVG